MQCSEVADRILDGSGKCVLLEPCKAGEYVSQKPTDSSAQVCSKVSACKDHEYESAAPGRGSDRQCLPITPTCKRGVTYEIAPPTLLSDRVCRPVKRDSGPPSWMRVCERGGRGVGEGRQFVKYSSHKKNKYGWRKTKKKDTTTKGISSACASKPGFCFIFVFFLGGEGVRLGLKHYANPTLIIWHTGQLRWNANLIRTTRFVKMHNGPANYRTTSTI